MIRTAELKDASSLLKLFADNRLDDSRLNDFEYQEEIQRKGFLLGDETQADFERYIQEREFFFVYEDAGEILGYICGDDKKDFLDDEYKSWIDTNAKELYYHDTHTYSVDMIAIDPTKHRTGVATQLLEHFEKSILEKGYTHLFAMVRILPMTNCASILFHAKHKFTRVAVSKPRTLYGIENGASFLYFKQIV